MQPTSRCDDDDIEGVPRDAVAYFDKGYDYSRKGEYSRAIAEYNKAIDMYPMYIYAYLHRGDAHFSMRHFEKAVLDYDKVLAYLNGYVGHAYRMKERSLERLKRERSGIFTRLSKRMTRFCPLLGNPWISIPLFSWLFPLLVSGGIAFLVYDFSSKLTASQVRDITGPMLTFLGVAVAILIAVFTATYVQSRNKRESGFNTFDTAIIEFRKLTRELINEIRKNHSPDIISSKVVQDRSTQCVSISKRLMNITPSWEGYESDTGLEPQLLRYFRRFDRMKEFIGQDLIVSEYPINHDEHIRGLLIGLLTMEEGVVGKLLSKRLMGILFSLSVLLVVSFAVRITSELGLIYVPPVGTHEFANLFVVVSLPSIAAAHFFAVIYFICVWQEAIQQRDEAWRTHVTE